MNLDNNQSLSFEEYLKQYRAGNYKNTMAPTVDEARLKILDELMEEAQKLNMGYDE